jgi:putative membrane protein insertion efficiency factor
MAPRHDKDSKVEIDSVLVIEGDELPPPAELCRAVREARPRQRLEVEAPARVGFGGRAVIALIRLYQRFLSGRLRRKCLLEPSCSRYAELAIAQNGVLRGSRETWQRLQRCRPENEANIDYPEGVRICLTK